MGNGAAFTSEESGKITQEMRDKYEKLKAEGLDDDAIRNQLTAEFNNLSDSFKKEKAQSSKSLLSEEPTPPPEKKSIGISKSAISSKIASGSAKVKKDPTSTSARGGNNRRKSFDGLKKPLMPVLAAPAPADDPLLAASASEPVVATEPLPEEVVDNWDSVTQQPFCKICEMAFKSSAFLDRHVKYSDIHAKNVAASAESSQEGTPTNHGGVSMKGGSKQVEGIDYKMVYTGSKFFWRTQDTVDLSFYHHIHPQVLEVIPHDVNRNKEMQRVYFSYTAILDLLAKGGTNTNDEDVKRTAITTYLLQRLQLAPREDKSQPLLMQFVPNAMDDTSAKNPFIEKPPLMVIPVAVTRRRRTNAEEIDNTINSLIDDRAALTAATGVAENEVVLG